ncbi:putative O-methyltransferase [Lophiostoma macrostomum CBS 122681]|uniref:Putative O-methyltransferase n=1 Tax=Lophiostoma macrostomum CBS 122681 TaxID=1314788 RepID=A0A6A6T8J7_9PLEO|nr:putative O-methyltransferase [Lophiostoma macrostomum CBS 122681]
MPSATRASHLVTTLALNVAAVESYLHGEGHPELSIEDDVPHYLQSNPAFIQPRDTIIQACRELLVMVQGAYSTITSQRAAEFANTAAVCHFDIASSFPEGQESATFDELAQNCKLPEPDVRRIVRGCIPNYIFQEKNVGEVSHTAASKALAKCNLLREHVEMMCGEILPGALKYTDAMEKWPGSEEPNQAGFNIANNTQHPAFEHMAKNGRLERFTNSMKVASMSPANSPIWLVEHYPWHCLDSGTLVDVGGSSGAYSIPIAEHYPEMKCIIQDLPNVVHRAEKEVPDNLRDRVTFMPHDFFTEQPVKSADVYLLRWVLHDWSDKYAIRIIRNLIPALAKHSKIVVQEFVLPEPGKIPTLEDRNLRNYDICMRGLSNGKERETKDWESLFARADPRFRIVGIVKPQGSALSIVEIAWEA